MKNFIAILLLLSFIACKPEKSDTSTKIAIPEIPEGVHSDNSELQEIYNKDQADRRVDHIDWSVVAENDRNRQKRVLEIIAEGGLKTSNDFKNAAMIFQHGGNSKAYGTAVQLMEQSVELDPKANKWLLAAATDRYLLSKGEPQIYGTQYSKSSNESKWKRSKMDTTKITDEQRKEFNVETLAEQREKVRVMNLTKLSEVMANGKGIEDVLKIMDTDDLKATEYDLTERGINSFGYNLMGQDKMEEALAIFKRNTELYPDAFNTWDSYGECLLKLGKKEEAVAMYKKSLELNANNTSATKVLTEMGSL